MMETWHLKQLRLQQALTGYWLHLELYMFLEETKPNARSRPKADINIVSLIRSFSNHFETPS